MASIVLLTDFGLQDPYVGIMKGVIHRLAPGVPIIDLAHGVPPQAVRVGALWLDGAVDWFAPGSIFTCVVDPGVGTARRIVAVEAGHWRFVAPDNGLLAAVLERYPVRRAFVAEDPRFHGPSVSATFHGRDVMAPVAGHWARGVDVGAFGPPAGALVPLDLPVPVRQGDLLVGEVLYVDIFGNLVTNLRGGDVPSGSTVRSGDRACSLVRTYGDVEPGALLALVGSTGRVEISVNGGNAARELGVSPGDTVVAELAGGGGP